VLALVLVWSSPGAAQSGSDEELAQLRLVDQTSWVGPEGTFRVTVEAPPGLPEGSVVLARLHQSLDLDELDAALDEGQLGDTIFTVTGRPTTEATDADGHLVVELPVSTTPSDDLLVARLSSSGVYPFEVMVMGPDERPIGRLVTTLLRLGDTPGTADAALSVGLVVPLVGRSEPALDGSPYLPDDEVDRVDAVVAATEQQPEVPLALDPTPETAALLVARSPEAESTLAEVAARSSRQVLSGPYADIDSGDLVASGLSDQLAPQYDTGAATLQALLGVVPDGRVGVLDRTDTGDAVQQLLGLGIESVVVPSDQLEPLGRGSDATFASGFDLLLPGGDTVPAVVADSRAATRLADTDDPVLAAQSALAELALLQLAQSDDDSGVALVVRPDTDPEAIAALLDGLADVDGAASGSLGEALVRPTTLTTLLRSTATAETTSSGRTTTLTRGYRSDEPTPLGPYTAELRRTLARLDGLRSLVGDAPTITEPAERSTLSSSARDTEPAARSANLFYADSTIEAATDEIVVAPEQVVTLTSSSGLVPLNLENRLLVPVTVRITMSSPKLDFPDGSVIEKELEASSTTPIQLRVETRATGAFPLDVTIDSADGTLPVTSTRYTVRSTAISGVGLVLSVGAGAFLLVWWARHWRTARRARKLVGSDHPALSGSGEGGYAPPHTDPREGR
jgi:hypothetical protein